MLKRTPNALKILLGLAVLVLLAIGLYFVPPVHSRVGLATEQPADEYHLFFPPAPGCHIPAFRSIAVHTNGRGQPGAQPLPPLPQSQPRRLRQILATTTPTITPTPIPASVILSNVPFVDQMGRYNYCGPANLTMALEYWGWKGDPTSLLEPRDQVAAVIKPGEDDPSLNFVDRGQSDVNVMPYEMVDFVNQHTNFKALFRYGGDLDLLKRLIAAGFPVITEKGIYEPLLPENTVQWGGHYALTTGYDDVNKDFIWQDSYLPLPTSVGKNTKTSYDDYLSGWRSFDYLFIVVYPADHETQLDQVLGPWADQYWAAQHALDIANQEIQSNTLTGNDLFFAMFNLVTSDVNLQNPDYGPAAAAYDQANAYYNNQLIQIDKSAKAAPLSHHVV